MTVSTTAAMSQFVADGLGTARTIEFQLRDPSDLKVEADGVVQASGVQYSIVGDYPTQQIVPLAPYWGAGTTILYYRSTRSVQEYRIPEGEDLRAASLEKELDRNALKLQEIEREVSRAPQVARGETAPGLDVSELNDGDILEYRGGRFKKKDLSPFAGQFAAISGAGQIVGVSGALPVAVPAIGSAITNDMARYGAPYNSLISELAGGMAANPLWWIGREHWAGIQDGTSTYDANVAIQQMVDDLWADFGGANVDCVGIGRLVGNFMIRSGIYFYGSGAHASATAADARRCVLLGNEAGPLIDTPPVGPNKTSIEGAGLQGFLFDGNGTAGVYGLHKHSGRKFWSVHNAWNGFDGPAIIDDAPPAGKVNGTLYIIENFAQNCMLDITGLAAFKGTYDLAGSDGRIVGGEVHGNVTGAMTSGDPAVQGFKAACVIRGADWEFAGPLFEFADAGIVFTGANATRAQGHFKVDNSYGDAVLMESGGSYNRLAGEIKRGGQSLTNTWAGIHEKFGAKGNHWDFIITDYPGPAGTKKLKYGCLSEHSTGNSRDKSDFRRCIVTPGAALTQDFKNTATTGANMPSRDAWVTITGDANPNVNGLGMVQFDNATLDSLNGGESGQHLFLNFLQDTTVAEGATITLNPANSRVFKQGSTLLLAWMNGKFRMTSTYFARQAAIAAPAGGAVIDAEARAAINALRAALTAAGVTS